MNLHQALQKYFGYREFLPLQEDIITDVLHRHDVFVLMPTGGGKSLCYQLPAVMDAGLVVVISPLIALMKDQVDSLRANGVSAAFINSSLKPKEASEIQAKLARKEINILYVSPERVLLSHFMPFLKSLEIGLFAVDEAHCISEWGHDFRPEYRQLRMLRTEFPGIPIVALTATAEPIVQKDICAQLHLKQPRMYVSSFDRKNLLYEVIAKEDSFDNLIEYLSAHRKDAGIIYCQSRKSVERLADKLRREKFRAMPYHAGLSTKERSEAQESFLRDDTLIIVATIAFGMGINKLNIRFVVHYDMPKNIEGYYQETGRAGRDGIGSECLLYYSYSDLAKIEHFNAQKTNEQDRENARKKLREMVQFCEATTCRRKILLRYFDEEYAPSNCGNCDNCINPRAQFDGTIAAQKLLSCVKRVGERFGAKYVIDVLLGSKAQKIVQNRHNSLSTFGIGEEFTRKQWFGVVRELVHLGYLDVVGSEYPVLALNRRSYDLLSGKERILLTQESEEDIAELRESSGERHNRKLFDELRAVRKAIADGDNVPPYIVFSDASLEEMATLYPQTLEQMRGIKGVGDTKLRRYGAMFIEAIKNHLAGAGEPLAPEEPAVPRANSKTVKPGQRSEDGWTKEENENLILEYLAGRSAEELAEKFKKKESAVVAKLVKLGLTK
ncbi:MAG TPA: DNA helicase RecQ [Bacteroidota bacterium]|nr:DNA helicase RecQ [Bacteroidota bacterium]